MVNPDTSAGEARRLLRVLHNQIQAADPVSMELTDALLYGNLVAQVAIIEELEKLNEK